jgi:hypothetical protein
LQENAGRQVIGFSGFEFSWLTPPGKRLRQAIVVPEDLNDKALSDFCMQKTTIIIDHVDMFMHEKDKSAVQTLEMVRELIKESEATQKFNVFFKSVVTHGSARRNWWMLGVTWCLLVMPLPDGSGSSLIFYLTRLQTRVKTMLARRKTSSCAFRHCPEGCLDS